MLTMYEALEYWRDKVWQAADAVGIKLTDDQLEAMTVDIVTASANAPEVDPLNMRTEG